MQRTLKSSIAFDGIGLHTGQPVSMCIRPAPAHAGVSFLRSDLPAGTGAIPARWDHVDHAQLCTRLSNEHGTTVSTVEHVMAALAGCGVHNAVIEIDGPEVPVLDGSATEFVSGFLNVGLVEQNAPVPMVVIRQEVAIEDGQSWLRLLPSDRFVMDYGIEFQDSAIGRQHLTLDLANGSFVRELADCRTFCRQSDVDAMRSIGLARGGNYQNAVVVDNDRVLTPGGMRRTDEPVRHKMLDAVGDLALAGGPILGHYQAFRGGHVLTNRLLRKAFAQPGAVEIVTAQPAHENRLPGFGILATDLRAVA